MSQVVIRAHDFLRTYTFYIELFGLNILLDPFRFKGKRTMAWLYVNNISIELWGLFCGIYALSEKE
jgi:hypothetical protein